MFEHQFPACLPESRQEICFPGSSSQSTSFGVPLHECIHCSHILLLLGLSSAERI